MAEQTRRKFLGRGGSLALAYALAGWGIEGTLEKAKQAATPIPEITHKKVAIGNWTFSNWPLYMDKAILKDFDKQFGGHVKYVEEINDNDEFYGKVRQQLQSGTAIGRDIVTLTGLHGRSQLGPQPLRRAARQEEHPERRQEPRRQPQVGPVRQEARLHGAVSVGRDRARLQPEEDRAASSARSTTCSTRRSRAA